MTEATRDRDQSNNDRTMMRFAVLCDDPMAAPVVEALATNVDGHQLVYAVRATSRSDDLLHGRPGIVFLEHWEDLLAKNDFDAVLIGGTDPQILEGTKQLAAAQVPILLRPHAAHGSTFIYEISLIRDDNHVALCPLFWHRFDEAVMELKGGLATGRWGRVQFLQLQRTIDQPTSGTPIAQATVDAELLHDTDLLRWLVGDYNQITALRTAATNEGVLVQSVVLAGRGLPEANWSITPATGPPEWKLTIRGEAGTAELDRNDSQHSWILKTSDRDHAGDQARTARDLVAAFAAKIAQAKTAKSASDEAASRDDWGELVKSFETIDATHRSVSRRRTIELHFEPMSERAIFKTQMTAIGCGLLMATFFLTLCYLGVASLVGPSPDTVRATQALSGDTSTAIAPLPWTHRVLAVLRLLVFAPLVLFLLAQILLPLTRPASREQSVPNKRT